MSRSLPSALAALAIAVLALTACSTHPVRVTDEDRSLTLEEAALLLDETDIESVSGQPVAEAESLRQSALGAMRSRNDVEAELASLLTTTFSGQSRAVPVAAERAEVDGVPAWIVVEAWGPPGGELNMKRLWILAESDGSVIFSSTSR